MKITWFGTASILLESEGEKLLFDPFVQLTGGSNPNSLEDFPADTDICISHVHVDHLFFLPDLLAVQDITVYGTIMTAIKPPNTTPDPRNLSFPSAYPAIAEVST